MDEVEVGMEEEGSGCWDELEAAERIVGVGAVGEEKVMEAAEDEVWFVKGLLHVDIWLLMTRRRLCCFLLREQKLFRVRIEEINLDTLRAVYKALKKICDL